MRRSLKILVTWSVLIVALAFGQLFITGELTTGAVVFIDEDSSDWSSGRSYYRAEIEDRLRDLNITVLNRGEVLDLTILGSTINTYRVPAGRFSIEVEGTRKGNVFVSLYSTNLTFNLDISLTITGSVNEETARSAKIVSLFYFLSVIVVQVMGYLGYTRVGHRVIRIRRINSIILGNITSTLILLYLFI